MSSEEQKKKKNEKIILILLILLLLSGAILTARIIHIKSSGRGGSTAVVPDNLISGSETDTESSDLSDTDTEIDSLTQESNTETDSVGATGTETEKETDRETEETKKAATLALYKGQAEDNQKFEVYNILPGDSVIGYFSVKADHDGDIIVYFSCDITAQTKTLGKALNIRVTHLDSGKTLYEGAMSLMSKDGYGLRFPASDSKQTVAYYEIEVYLPVSTGNEYQAAHLECDLNWFLKDDGNLVSPPTGFYTSIDTGLIIMFASAALMLFLILSKRRRQET